VFCSVIIVSYNSSALLIECVRSVLASALPIEVIVSDNGSSDCSIEPLVDMAAADGRLRVLSNGRNLGFAAGNNAALPLARGDYILFLNPDCIVRPDTLARMVAALGARPAAGMAGCLIRNADGSEEKSCRRRLPTPRALLGQLFSSATQSGEAMPTAPVAVEAISGAFMMVRRAMLERIGSFDDGYFMHWEDVDLCQRFQAAGPEILFVPDVEVTHFKGRSSRRRPLRIEWYKHRGLMRFFRKFHFAGWRALLFAPVAAAIVVRFLLVAGRMRFKSQVPREVVEQEDGGDPRKEVWVFGATSLVGRCLLPRLLAAGCRVRAFCSDPARAGASESPHLTWHAHDMRGPASLPSVGRPDALINLAPVFALPPWLPALAERGLREVIAFGSTSAFTKADSANEAERRLANDLMAAEDAVGQTCRRLGLRWAIFRPTMIYSLGHDRNITRLARFVARMKFFPMPGEGRGLRQPVHADDLAKACIALFAWPERWNRSYNLSGGEVLSYRAMVEVIFRRLGCTPRIVGFPAWLWHIGLALARFVPGYRDLNLAMLRRVDIDMCFSHDEATRAFGFAPRRFMP
jgi:GT2 family glycosyltransferase/nucleoside-diphosphate-sugar epimerase